MRASARLLTASVVGVVIVALLGWAVLAAYHPVRPRVMCQMPLGTGGVVVFFGHTNQLDIPVTVPAGDKNRVSSWARVEALPTVFPPGASSYPDALFAATFHPRDVPDGEVLSWRLGPRTVRVTDDTPRCDVPKLPVPPEDVVWVQPKPVEIAKVEPEVVQVPEPPPEVALPEPKPEAKPEPKPETAPPPKKAERRPPKPKNEVAAVKTDAPVALALTGLTNAPGGMAIQKGEHDAFGDAAVTASTETTAPREAGTPDGTADGTGVAERAPPKRVAARVKVRPKGEWPADAPPRAGAVLVRLSLLVGTDGRVKDVKVVRKAGPAFDREARAVGMKASFDPATVDGVAVESWVPWDVEFTPDTW